MTQTAGVMYVNIASFRGGNLSSFPSHSGCIPGSVCVCVTLCLVQHVLYSSG